MTVNIALILSSDGIALAHRQTAGHWAMIGETALDVPDLGAALADLRGLAVEREGDGFDTLLVLPDDQILYTSLTAPTSDPDLTAYRIEDGLEGLTPYAVTELEYDWRAFEEDRVKIAVVARETLDEARGFASQYGFTCKGFAAMPPMERFPGVPTFDLGDEVAAMGFTEDGIAFGPDSFGLPEPEPTPEPESEEPAASAGPEAADEPTPEVTPAPEVSAAPEPTALEAPAVPAADATAEDEPSPLPEPSPEDQNSALAEALQAAAAASAERDAALDEASAVQAIEDPSVSGPIASIASEGATDDALDTGPDSVVPDTPVPPVTSQEPTTSQEVVGDAGGDDDLLPPAISPAALTARQRARALRGEAPTSADTPSSDTAAPASPVSATRGPATAPDGVDRPITPPSASGAAAPGRSMPTPERGSLVGQRSSRLGLAHPDGPGRTPSPEAAPSAPTPAAPPVGGTPMPRLAEQLQRVRNASKSRPPGVASGQQSQPPRPRVEITPQPELSGTGATASRRPSPFDDPPAASGKTSGRLGGLLNRSKDSAPKPTASKAPDSQASAPRADATSPASEPAATSARAPASAPSASIGGLLRRRRTADDNAQTSETTAATTGHETFMSGLLVRKSVRPTGGSFKTGLVLTAILLLLLALVAIWSAIFLPNSAVARLFGVSTEEVATTNGLPAPEVITSTPVIGTAEDVAPVEAVQQPSLADEAAADGVELAEDDPTVVVETPVIETDPEEVAAADPDAALPDIDADLDLPPLPVIDQGQNPSVEEAEALYAEDGIWARSPERPDLAPFDLLDRVYTASIDPDVSAFDAVALPDPGVNPGETLRRFPPPPPFGTEYDLTADGLVAPTPQGVLTPEGAFVVLGTPPGFVATPRPREVAPTTPAIDVEDAVLGTFRPAERPGDLAETRERQVLGGLTQVELSERRPAARPASPQEAAAQASLFPGGDGAADPDAVDAAVAQALEGTDLAVARSLMPRTRPGNIAQIVASADRTPTEAPTAVAAAAVAAGPSIPSNADVSRAATERNAIRLRNVNLIGVSGSASDRRALVRLASGRFVRVTVGDRLDGGRVAAIGETTLQYVRSGRTVTLEIPG
ncbi:hypothetical protein KUL25_07320 [Rhodobacteraceae bacterium N5(2021)]|uniref:Type IV pilus biogenesis protein PilP n=1 Tax=Gymnodinialimonas phycosphaerae TaxID=2841589 RepID=A0A975TY43_9RHOB|nr:hypothetical protein [Gymnodinialimonas phycosphaerae]MBY4892572.1 hypothetical protein [Gymnodinialimonas phycosphaerae]